MYTCIYIYIDIHTYVYEYKDTSEKVSPHIYAPCILPFTFAITSLSFFISVRMNVHLDINICAYGYKYICVYRDINVFIHIRNKDIHEYIYEYSDTSKKVDTYV